MATWLAVLSGTLGLHRFYLYGLRDWAGWLYPLPTLLGLLGVQRMRDFGVDDRAAWLLVPLLGLSISAAMFSAILYGLTTDEKWAARHGAGTAAHASAGADTGTAVVATAWAPVLGVMLALLLGAAVFMGTLTFAIQKFFEW